MGAALEKKLDDAKKRNETNVNAQDTGLTTIPSRTYKMKEMVWNTNDL